jgi:hypothetical protein
MSHLDQAGIDPRRVRHWKFSQGKTAHLQPLQLKNLAHVLQQTKPCLISMGIMDGATFDEKLKLMLTNTKCYGLDWWFHRVWFQPVYARKGDV